MTDEHRPDLEEARRRTEESAREARETERVSAERASWKRTLAERLRRLREENGFDQLFEEAYGRGR